MPKCLYCAKESDMLNEKGICRACAAMLGLNALNYSQDGKIICPACKSARSNSDSKCSCGWFFSKHTMSSSYAEDTILRKKKASLGIVSILIALLSFWFYQMMLVTYIFILLIIAAIIIIINIEVTKKKIKKRINEFNIDEVKL